MAENDTSSTDLNPGVNKKEKYQNLPGTPGNKNGGRPKGKANKFTQFLNEAIEKSFKKIGGMDWLIKQATENPNAYMRLLEKRLPQQVKMELTNGPDPNVFFDDAQNNFGNKEEIIVPEEKE